MLAADGGHDVPDQRRQPPRVESSSRPQGVPTRAGRFHRGDQLRIRAAEDGETAAGAPSGRGRSPGSADDCDAAASSGRKRGPGPRRRSRRPRPTRTRTRGRRRLRPRRTLRGRLRRRSPGTIDRSRCRPRRRPRRPTRTRTTGRRRFRPRRSCLRRRTMRANAESRPDSREASVLRHRRPPVEVAAYAATTPDVPRSRAWIAPTLASTVEATSAGMHPQSQDATRVPIVSYSPETLRRNDAVSAPSPGLTTMRVTRSPASRRRCLSTRHGAEGLAAPPRRAPPLGERGRRGRSAGPPPARPAGLRCRPLPETSPPPALRTPCPRRERPLGAPGIRGHRPEIGGLRPRPASPRGSRRTCGRHQATPLPGVPLPRPPTAIAPFAARRCCLHSASVELWLIAQGPDGRAVHVAVDGAERTHARRRRRVPGSIPAPGARALGSAARALQRATADVAAERPVAAQPRPSPGRPSRGRPVAGCADGGEKARVRPRRARGRARGGSRRPARRYQHRRPRGHERRAPRRRIRLGCGLPIWSRIEGASIYVTDSGASNGLVIGEMRLAPGSRAQGEARRGARGRPSPDGVRAAHRSPRAGRRRGRLGALQSPSEDDGAVRAAARPYPGCPARSAAGSDPGARCPRAGARGGRALALEREPCDPPVRGAGSAHGGLHGVRGLETCAARLPERNRGVPSEARGDSGRDRPRAAPRGVEPSGCGAPTRASCSVGPRRSLCASCERRAPDRDFLELRVGLATQQSSIEVEALSRGVTRRSRRKRASYSRRRELSPTSR